MHSLLILLILYYFFAQAQIPFTEVLCKNRYVGRSFILPDERSRELAIAKEFGAITQNLVDKKVVLVDDSIVRGNTVAKLIKLIRTAGAREVKCNKNKMKFTFRDIILILIFFGRCICE